MQDRFASVPPYSPCRSSITRHQNGGCILTTIRSRTEGKRRVSPPWLALIAAGAVASSAGYFWFAGQASGAATSGVSQPQAVPVGIVKPTIQDTPVYLYGLGTVQAFNTVNVKTRIDGELQSVSFTEGQSVKRGDLLAVIDPRSFQAALDQATAKVQQDQANLKNAQFILSKDQTLTKENVTTVEALETQQSTVDSLVAQIAEDQAAKEAAAVSLSYTQIHSPIDGRTGFRQVDPGNQVHAADTGGIVTITQTQPISVVSTLPEDDLALVREALKSGPVEVTAFSQDRSTKLATGTVSLIDNEIDQTTATIRIKSTFANTDESLWPGEFVNIRIRQKTLTSAVTIPPAALQRGPDGFFVYVIDANDVAQVRSVTPGPIDNGRAVVEKGLDGTEQVVTSGQYRLQPGTHVAAQSGASEPTAQKE
jgi:multidrug efflux system membrane fusion protein